jgi:hypothetical protein
MTEHMRACVQTWPGCLGLFQVAHLLHSQALHNDSTHDSMYAKPAVRVIRTIVKKIDGPQAWANDCGFKCQIIKSSKTKLCKMEKMKNVNKHAF